MHCIGVRRGDLGRVIGEKRAREMFLYCRPVGAQEALQWGLVNKVVPLDKLQEEVEAWCRRLLEMSWTCLKMGKRIFVEAAKMDTAVGDVAEEFEATAYLASEESREGMRAFVEKRKPDFSKYR
jgi:1,4-dihydroxy-2-naphthoyl-CoA synthase